MMVRQGERRDVEGAAVGELAGGDFGFEALADDVEFALELVGGHAGALADEDLLDVGLGAAGDASDSGAVGGDVAPAEVGEAFVGDHALDDAFALEALVAFDGKEDLADAVLARCGEREAEFVGFAGEEFVGDLDQDAGAVAGFGVATTSYSRWVRLMRTWMCL